MSENKGGKNMPRKPSKKTEELEKIKSEEVKSTRRKSTKKSDENEVTTTNKKTTTTTKKGKTTSKKTSTKSSLLEKILPTKSAKDDTKVKSKKTTTRTRKTSTTKKSTSYKSTTLASARTSKAKKVSKDINPDDITASTNLTQKIEILEYYDLPYRYNQTVVKVLAQTPTTLFIYWDISDDDRNNFIKQYGENFFNDTKPVLVIHNNTMHYSFEIDINDFANSWYLHVNDANCEYSVELGRRPKYYNDERHVDIPNNYLYVSSSNTIEAPNDHVLFDKNLKTVYFKDVKTNIVTAKEITSISFIRNIGKIYNLYDLRSDFNKNSWINSNHWQLDLKNPSSTSSSTFK